MLPGRPGRVLRPGSIAGGQGGGGLRDVGVARLKSTQFGGGLDGRVGGRPGRIRVALERKCQAQECEAVHPEDVVVGCLGLGGDFAKLCGGSGYIALI